MTYFSVAEVAKTFGCIAERLLYRCTTEDGPKLYASSATGIRNRCHPCSSLNASFCQSRSDATR